MGLTTQEINDFIQKVTDYYDKKESYFTFLDQNRNRLEKIVAKLEKKLDVRLVTLSLLSYQYFEVVGEVSYSGKLLQKASHIAEYHKLNDLIPAIRLRLANYEDYSGSKDEAIQQLEETIVYFRIQLVKALNSLAVVKRSQDAKILLEEANQLIQKGNIPPYLGSLTKLNLGMLTDVVNKEEAVRLWEESRIHAEDVRRSELVVDECVNLSNHYIFDDFEQAKKIIDSGLSLAKEIDYHPGVVDLLNQLALAYNEWFKREMEAGNPVEEADLNTAVEKFDEGVALAKKQENLTSQAYLYMNYGELLSLDTKIRDEARSDGYFVLAFETSEKIKRYDLATATFWLHGEAYEHRGQPQLAKAKYIEGLEYGEKHLGAPPSLLVQGEIKEIKMRLAKYSNDE